VRNDVTKGCVRSRRNLRKKFGGKVKVTLSSGKMLMPEVGRQKGKFDIQILTVSIPAS
jgi:hypothetical protein